MNIAIIIFVLIGYLAYFNQSPIELQYYTSDSNLFLMASCYTISDFSQKTFKNYRTDKIFSNVICYTDFSDGFTGTDASG